MLWAAKASALDFGIYDFRDTLDKAVSGPDLLGGAGENALVAYLADRETYDSNIYRLSSGTNASSIVGPKAVNADHVNSPSAGLDGQWGIGRQFVDVELRVDDNRYAHDSDLNNVSSADKVLWNWSVASALTGQIGADYTRQLLSFVSAFVYAPNIYQRTEYFATGRYQLGPRWTVFGGVLGARFTVGDSATRGNNSTAKTTDVGVEMATDVNDSFSVDYHYNDTRFPYTTTLNNATFNPDFREDRLQLLIKRLLSEKTFVDVSLGYLKRTYANTSIGSFSGEIGRGSLAWQPTDKTRLIVAGWRQLGAYLTDQTNYYVGTGGSLTPQWLPTEKITVGLTASRENQEFIGSSANVLNQAGRRAAVTAAQIRLAYAPIQSLTVDFSYRHEQRSSDVQLRAYTDNLASAGIKFAF